MGLKSALTLTAWLGLTLALAFLWSAPPSDAAEPNPAAPLYWCPNKNPDQQYKTVPQPGCVPFVEKKEADQTGDKPAKEERQIKAEDIQSEASAFLQRYRQFLSCCVDDPNSIHEVQELEDQASKILRAVQETGFINMGTSQRGRTVQEIIRPVAQARDDLRKLHQRLQGLGESRRNLNMQDLEYEQAGKEQRRIQEQEEGLKRDFRPTAPPESARTGTEIHDTTIPNRVGTQSQDTTIPGATGTAIGGVVSPNTNQQVDLRPRRGLDTQDTSIPTRVGPDTQDTSLPNSFGFDVGTQENPSGSSTQPRVGPAIGDSSSNRR